MVNNVAISGVPSNSSSAPADLGRSGATEKRPARERTEAFAYYEHTELEMRLTSKDGDVLEVRGSFTYAAAYAMQGYSGPLGRAGAPGRRCGPGEEAAGAECGNPGDKASLRSAEDVARAVAEGKTEELADWAREVRDALRRQQVEMLEKAMKGFAKGGQGEASEGRMLVISVAYGESLRRAEGAEGPDAASDAGVPEYWNAENTSDRIVAFATSFAALHGQDAEKFAQTLTKAVTAGFDQAAEITGALPGAAGKLLQETRDLVFGKLSKWLEEWKAASYNQPALPSENEPAAAA